MALSEDMQKWVKDRVHEARDILADATSTESMKTLARDVLARWESVLPPCDTEG
jgi:hypothetical protein